MTPLWRDRPLLPAQKPHRSHSARRIRRATTDYFPSIVPHTSRRRARNRGLSLSQSAKAESRSLGAHGECEQRAASWIEQFQWAIVSNTNRHLSHEPRAVRNRMALISICPHKQDLVNKLELNEELGCDWWANNWKMSLSSTRQSPIACFRRRAAELRSKCKWNLIRFQQDSPQWPSDDSRLGKSGWSSRLFGSKGRYPELEKPLLPGIRIRNNLVRQKCGTRLPMYIQRNLFPNYCQRFLKNLSWYFDGRINAVNPHVWLLPSRLNWIACILTRGGDYAIQIGSRIARTTMISELQVFTNISVDIRIRRYRLALIMHEQSYAFYIWKGFKWIALVNHNYFGRILFHLLRLSSADRGEEIFEVTNSSKRIRKNLDNISSGRNVGPGCWSGAGRPALDMLKLGKNAHNWISLTSDSRRSNKYRYLLPRMPMRTPRCLRGTTRWLLFCYEIR